MENKDIFDNPRVRQLSQIQQEALQVFIQKNTDYGDAFAKYGLIGVLMRIEDKIQRCLSITKNGVNLVTDEGLKDTLLDLHNYSAMALMLHDEQILTKNGYAAYNNLDLKHISRDKPINCNYDIFTKMLSSSNSNLGTNISSMVIPGYP